MLDAGEMGRNKDVCLGLSSHRPILVSTMIPVHHRKLLQACVGTGHWRSGRRLVLVLFILGSDGTSMHCGIMTRRWRE